MSNTELLIRLRDLHEELAVINDDLKTTEHVDEETIDALGQLVTDVGGLVDQTRQVVDADDSSASSATQHHDVAERITQFETQHPRVVDFLSRMTDVLAMLGI